MRIFCTGTGRCGTSTLARAFECCTNYTVGQETKVGPSHLDLDSLLDYPDNHIEVSPHLVIVAPLLMERYPDARWILLARNKHDCIRSIASNCEKSIAGFVYQWLQVELDPEPTKESDPKEYSRTRKVNYEKSVQLFYSLVNASVESLFSRLPAENCFVLNLEELTILWPEVWKKLGVEGDIGLSMKELARRYNPTVNRGRSNFI